MITDVTEEGVLVPKEMFGDMERVKIIKQDGMIVIVSVSAEDPIFQLGKNPVICGVTDASENLDKYLYGSLLSANPHARRINSLTT